MELDFPSECEENTQLTCTLTLDEVVQIRMVTAKAELLNLQVEDMALFWKVWNEKVNKLCNYVCVYVHMSVCVHTCMSS